MKKTLTALAKENNFLVIDTSALFASNASSPLREEYRDEVARTLADYGNICTVQDVAEEVRENGFRKSGPDASLSRGAILRKWISRGNDKSLFEGLISYLVPSAMNAGIVEDWKEHPFSDVKLIALALTLGHRNDRVVLASSDRQLNRFAHSVLNQIYRPGPYPPRFPCTIRGDIQVYTFIQKKAIFDSNI
jgi:hypothetical protein